jgi:hypothetical protein
MVHPLVDQLRFTRSEFERGLEGLTEDEARRRLMPMNCISWNVGHLAWQEQKYFLFYAQGQLPFPEINEEFAYGAAASTPSLRDVLEAWRAITAAVDPWLDTRTNADLLTNVVRNGKPSPFIYGSLLLRVIYHYWYHTGENMAIRQSLGHTGLPEFVGDIDGEAPYMPEPGG